MATPSASTTRSPGRLVGLAVLLWAAIGLIQTTSAQTREVKKTFPRLAGIQIGNNPYPGGHNDPDYQRAISRFDVAILSQHASDETAIDIKRMNPDILLGRYTNIIAVSYKWCCDHETWREKLGRETGPDPAIAPDWFLRTPEGEFVEHWPGTYQVNITDYVRPDGNGDIWVDYRVKYDVERWFKNPVWDIWFSDSVHFRPRSKGGVWGTYSGGKAEPEAEWAAYRRGHRRHWDNIYAARPGTIVSVNFNWYLHQHQTGRWDLTEYDKQVQSAVFENAMGEKSPADDTGWEVMYRWYRWGESYLKQPSILIFHVKGSRNDYQFARYSFASALMGDGFFKFSPDKGTPGGDYRFGTVEWFDEFDLAGAASTSWLGLAVAPPPDGPWQKGVYRRDFENGVALVNPKRNGPQTVTIEEGFRRFLGTQDPAVNNGQPAGQIALKAGDGIVLVRESAIERPAPPDAPRLRIGS